MTWDNNIFLAACIGSVAPEIVRLYQCRFRKIKIDSTPFYIVISILFIMLSGTMAILLSAKTILNAIYIGISLPTIISAIGQKPPAGAIGLSGNFLKEDVEIEIESIGNYLWLLFRR